VTSIVSWRGSGGEAGNVTETYLASSSDPWLAVLQLAVQLQEAPAAGLWVVALQQEVGTAEQQEQELAPFAVVASVLGTAAAPGTLASSRGILAEHPVLAWLQVVVATPLGGTAAVARLLVLLLALGTAGMQLVELTPAVELGSRKHLAAVQDSHSHRVGHLDTLGYLWQGPYFHRLTLHMKGES